MSPGPSLSDQWRVGIWSGVGRETLSALGSPPAVPGKSWGGVPLAAPKGRGPRLGFGLEGSSGLLTEIIFS